MPWIRATRLACLDSRSRQRSRVSSDGVWECVRFILGVNWLEFWSLFGLGFGMWYPRRGLGQYYSCSLKGNALSFKIKIRKVKRLTASPLEILRKRRSIFFLPRKRQIISRVTKEKREWRKKCVQESRYFVDGSGVKSSSGVTHGTALIDWAPSGG